MANEVLKALDDSSSNLRNHLKDSRRIYEGVVWKLLQSDVAKAKERGSKLENRNPNE